MNQAIYKIPHDMLLDFLTGKLDLELPDGVERVSIWLDDNEQGGLLCLRLQHESFPAIEPMNRYPVRNVLRKPPAREEVVLYQKARA